MSQPKSLLRRLSTATLRRSRSFLSQRPGLEHQVLAIIRALGLHGLVRALRARMAPDSQSSDSTNGQGFMPTDAEQLSPRARQIYADLKLAFERRRKENG